MTARHMASSVRSRSAGLTTRYTCMCTPSAAKKITRSACARQHRESVAVMPRRSEPLSAKDKKEIAVRRAKAHAWARRLLKEHAEDAALIAAAKSDPDNPPLR